MTLIALEGAGLWVPSTYPDLFEQATPYVIDAASEMAAMILRCPIAGDLDRFDAYVHTVTNSPDNGLRLSFQGVSLTTGLPDGVILGATNNAFTTYAHTVTTGWKQTNFGEVVTVARNQLIACVVDIPSFTAGDSIAMRGIVSSASAFPYGISVLSTKNTGTFPLIGLHYTTGYQAIGPFVPTFQSWGSASWHVNSATADEWGLGFQVPWPCKLNSVRACLGVAAGADFEVLVYDSADNVIATLTHDGDVTVSSGQTFYQFFTGTELTLTKNTTYRVTFRPTTVNTVSMTYLNFFSAEHMNTMGGGDNFYMTSRLNQAGAWTDYNAGTFRRPHIALQLSAFDDGVSEGGSGGHSGFNAGFN